MEAQQEEQVEVGENLVVNSSEKRIPNLLESGRKMEKKFRVKA